MPRLSFLAGLAAGYVLGTRAGRERYGQIKRVSNAIWTSPVVQRQMGSAKEAARTKAAPFVADLVADAARTTGQRLRSSATVTSETVSWQRGHADPDVLDPNGTDAWAAATTPTTDAK